MSQHVSNKQTQYLVNGYCREIRKLLRKFNFSIPPEIINLVVTFYEITAIINIALGQCGNALNDTFFKSLIDEYNINKDGTLKANSASYVGNTYLNPNLYILPFYDPFMTLLWPYYMILPYYDPLL